MRVGLGLLLWSLAEISAFVVVGGWIGVLGVLAVVLGTGVGGVFVIRRQGVALAGAMRHPGGMRQAGQAGLLVLGAILLILPGLLTDVAGLALMLPQVRGLIAGRIGTRVVRAGSAAGDIVEGEAVEVEPSRLGEPSGWTRP